MNCWYGMCTNAFVWKLHFLCSCIRIKYNIRSEQYKKKKKKVDEMALSKVEQLNFQVRRMSALQKGKFEVKAIF